ncbi:MAG TPA: YihY/virulence factor BrkB family protein [Acidimicrobiales bacterium]|nr:YihY/virulence factor BrkB family protein [Acidimicrobiales bacterium]
MTDDVSEAEVREERHDRGRDAGRPGEVPPRGWKDVALRLQAQAKEDDVPLLAAGVAFFGMLALVPALVALVSVYGLVADPADVQRSVEDALQAAPAEVRDLVSSQLSSIVESSPSGLRLGVIAGVAVALWSTSSGVQHLMGALTRAYGEVDRRGFVRRRGLALVLTLGLVVVATITLGVVVAPGALDPGTGRSVLSVVRWVVVAAIALASLSLLYRWAPDRTVPRLRWASPGAVLAAVTAVATSVGFSVYTANFGRYNETYGALGAVVVLLLWLYLTSYAVVLGAELNAELERQTRVDTTTGPVRPAGRRGAHAADTLGRSTA